MHDSPDNPMHATSIRLHSSCLDDMATIAKETGLSRSDIIRASIKMLRDMRFSADNLRLAVVDVNDKKGNAHFKVAEWLDYPLT